MKCKNFKYSKIACLLLLCISVAACEDFLEIDLPNNKMMSETVFNDEGSAESAVQGVYNQLSQAYFAAGGANSVTVLAGLSADNLITTIYAPKLQQFEQNEIAIQNPGSYDVWASTYNIIYQSNAVIEGLETSTGIPDDMRDQMMGEVKFIRGYVYFYLVNLYGEVPLILSTDYHINATISSSPVEMIYNQILEDLQTAKELLLETGQAENRLRANAHTVKALLARVYLYQKDWAAAEELSTEVIQSGSFQLEEELNEVFLANSTGAIWQISPLSTGSGALHTTEGNFFILEEEPNSLTPVALSPQLLSSFSTEDERKEKWINSFVGEEKTFYYPYKYKVKYATTGEATEYSMLMRFAEQWLIRAESRTQMGNLTGAIADLDKIRERAGLPGIAMINPNITAQALLDSIGVERRREFFTEWGHRWLDLKRLGKATEILAPQKPMWQSTDVLYPIPEEELMKNPNLNQNPGY